MVIASSSNGDIALTASATDINNLSGSVSLVAGGNVTISNGDNNDIAISASDSVDSLNGLSGALTLDEGPNMVIASSSNGDIALTASVTDINNFSGSGVTIEAGDDIAVTNGDNKDIAISGTHDHSVYLLLDGTRAMTGDLDLNGNEIVDPSHVKIGDSPPTASEGPLYIDHGASGDSKIIGGTTINPAGSFVNGTSGRAGYLYELLNDSLGATTKNCAFGAFLPFDLTNPRNGSAGWKAYRVMADATMVDKFWVSAEGHGFFSGTLGLGTADVPHGSLGGARFALEGVNNSLDDGPHIQFTTDSDDHPLLQILNFRHDNITLNFDAYWGPTWTSSDAGSNFQLSKNNDVFKINYDSGVTVGSTVTWNTGIILRSNGKVGVKIENDDARFAVESDSTERTVDWYRPTTTSGDDLFNGFSDVGAGTGNLHIKIEADGDVFNTNNSYGALSDRKLKKNERLMDDSEIDALMQIPVKYFELKSQPGVRHCGFVAQDVEQHLPGLVKDVEWGSIKSRSVIKGVKFSQFIPLLVRSNQILSSKIDMQEDKIKNLEERLSALESMLLGS